MNREQRRPYHAMLRTLQRESAAVLDEEYAFSLCHLCRYVEWNDADEPSCTHPVDQHTHGDRCFDVWSGMDCWLFRPSGRTPDEAATLTREWMAYQKEREDDVRAGAVA